MRSLLLVVLALWASSSIQAFRLLSGVPLRAGAATRLDAVPLELTGKLGAMGNGCGSSGGCGNGVSGRFRLSALSMSLEKGPAKEKGPPKKKLKDDVVQVDGKVVESLPNAMFRVEIQPSKQVVLATISGRIRKNFVRILVGDSVVCELSAYDLTKGRITYRNK